MYREGRYMSPGGLLGGGVGLYSLVQVFGRLLLQQTRDNVSSKDLEKQKVLHKYKLPPV